MMEGGRECYNFEFALWDDSKIVGISILQMIMLEGAKATTETVDALRTGASAMKAMQKATYVVLQGLPCIGSLVSFLTCYLFIQFWTVSSTPGTSWFCGLICNLHFISEAEFIDFISNANGRALSLKCFNKAFLNDYYWNCF